MQPVLGRHSYSHFTTPTHTHTPTPCTQVDRDTLEMLKAIGMGALPGVTVAQVAAAGGAGGAGGFKGGFRK